ncbi:hypothetical protein HYT52_00100 [Candidatus Woesearchaeota archaeon]|nr:hypothetical protein [Candidatus Woesearchaeota archaeon]
MSFIKRSIQAATLVALLSVPSPKVSAAPLDEVNKIVEILKAKGERGSIEVNGIETTKYELVLDGTTVEGVSYDYVRLSYVPAKKQGEDYTSLSLALFRNVSPGKYEGLIIYDGSRFGKMDGAPDKILRRKFSWTELAEMWWTEGKSLERYAHSDPDQESKKIYDYFLHQQASK